MEAKASLLGLSKRKMKQFLLLQNTEEIPFHIFFFQIFNFIIVVLGYTATFTKVLTIYLS
jgi:hypothetical protein